MARKRPDKTCRSEAPARAREAPRPPVPQAGTRTPPARPKPPHVGPGSAAPSTPRPRFPRLRAGAPRAEHRLGGNRAAAAARARPRGQPAPARTREWGHQKKTAPSEGRRSLAAPAPARVPAGPYFSSAASRSLTCSLTFSLDAPTRAFLAVNGSPERERQTRCGRAMLPQRRARRAARLRASGGDARRFGVSRESLLASSVATCDISGRSQHWKARPQRTAVTLHRLPLRDW